MDQTLKKKLLTSRQAIKRKFDELRNNIVHHENYLEKKFKPIADPLKELLKNVKVERAEIKSESLRDDLSFSSPKAVSSPKQKSIRLPSSSHQLSFSDQIAQYDPTEQRSVRMPNSSRRLSFLESQPVAQYDPIEEEAVESDPFVHIDPQQLEDIQDRSVAVREYLESYGGLSRDYISGLLTDTVKKYDINYGPRREILKNQDGKAWDTGKWLLGNSYIDFSKQGDLIRITTPDKHTYDYKGSLALYELIFKTLPNKATTNKDEQARRDYQDIMRRTNLNRSGFKPDGKLRSNVGRKWLDIIKPIYNEKFDEPKPIRPLLSQTSMGRSSISRSSQPSTSQIPRADQSILSQSTREGRGVLNLDNRKVQYVPYKNPNTLVNRLKILIGSQLAGNTSHDNEIVYIIDELKRSKVIK